MTIGNGSMPLRIGNLINTTVYGGPIRECPSDMFGVKMAVEIDCPHNVSVPTEDFNVPQVSDLRIGVLKALMATINGETVYAGCWGGIGRTGIFLAALAKVQIEYRKTKHRPGRGEDPVLYVRKHFIPHAVETQQQKDFINDFDVRDIVSWLDSTQRAMGMGGFTPSKDATVLPEYIIRMDDEALDNFKADWKEYRRGELTALVERDLDWTDDPEADSASEFVVDEGRQIDSLQNQVDELAEVQVKLILANKERAQALSNVAQALHRLTLSVKEHVDGHLTKQTWRESISQWMKRQARFHF